jgi:hypothetical protein
MSWLSWWAGAAAPPEIEALAVRYDHYYDFEKTLAVAKEHGLAFPMPE